MTPPRHRRFAIAPSPRLAVAHDPTSGHRRLCVRRPTAVPLALEVLWRFDGEAGSHLQPEVATVEKGGQTVAKGKDPYPQRHQLAREGPLPRPRRADLRGLPALSAPHGGARDPEARHHDNGLSDARIFFCLTTLAVAAVALYLCRADGRRKMRTFQVIAILPTAALPLATGGDDIPVVAFLLLAMVLAQRRQPFASGVVLGIASAMKFTAWPLAALALFAARDRRGERRPGTMLAGMFVVAVPTIFPFALRGPCASSTTSCCSRSASGVTSPAASALPGHVLVTAFPFLHRALPLVSAWWVAAVLARHLYRRTPRTASEVCTFAGVVMSAIILLAPATRIGYLLYPINFFVWAYSVRRDSEPSPTETPERALEATPGLAARPGSR